jgi:hypothetical protein
MATACRESASLSVRHCAPREAPFSGRILFSGEPVGCLAPVSRLETRNSIINLPSVRLLPVPIFLYIGQRYGKFTGSVKKAKKSMADFVGFDVDNRLSPWYTSSI